MIRRTPIRKVSKREGQRRAEYRKLAKEFIGKHPHCAVSLLIGRQWPGLLTQLGNIRTAVEVHHSRGRRHLLLMERWWVPVSREGHRWIEDHPEIAKTLFWFNRETGKHVRLSAGMGEWLSNKETY